MTRVLLFCVDIPPMKNVPVSGGGMRAWTISEALTSSGFDVIVSLPVFQYLSKKYWEQIPPELKANAWDWGEQDKITRRVDPDVILYSSNWGVLDLNRTSEVPAVIDLHGPTLLEFYFGHGQKITGEELRLKMKKLSSGDFYVFLSRRQRFYFTSWLLSTGIVLRKDQYGIVPFCVSPTLPELNNESKSTDPVFLFAGGFYPWHDPRVGIRIVTETLHRLKRGKLLMFTESHRLNPSDMMSFDELRRDVSGDGRVELRGLVPHDTLLKEYRKAHVALDLMKWNLERELAFTTRTVEYLSYGLPVIYNNYAELSGYIEKYKAGWCVDPEDPVAIREVVEHILDNPQELKEYSINAQTLVKENFTWDKTITPLVEFCKNPKKREKTDNLLQ